MTPNVTGWWTDERVDATVTSQYVHTHLRPNEAEQLTKSVFGDLSDDTYLEWILTRSKRFFLTLVEAGVPDQIFGVIDDSWDDEDLPIPEEEVSELLLSAEPDKALDSRFHRAQFKYLIRIVGDGEHIRYAQHETIPVNTHGMKPIVGKGKDAAEKVKLPSHPGRIFTRKRIGLKNRLMEEEVLAEIAQWRTFAHEHVISIFGSYTTNDSLYVLMTPSSECSLRSFLNDTPKAFEALAKSERRKTMLQWLHCLANGLAWLHYNGKHHGAIRPSRVGIDEQFRIHLGLFDGNGILCDGTVKDDIEAYQYAAPERWKRSVTIQATGNARTALPSGGRTGRRMTGEERSMSADSQETHKSPTGLYRLNTDRPTSVSYAFSPTSKSGSRLKLGSTRIAVARVGEGLRRSESRQTTHVMDGIRPTRTSLETHARPGAMSVLSTTSSNENTRSRRQTGPIYAAAPEMRTAVVQTWTSAQHDQLAADIFAMGAIMMEILTCLCKHSYSSFSRHRASKNKSAGRGGGLADASFHANTNQVFSWANMLQKDAEKKIKKEDGNIFKAVGPCLQIVLQCLDRDPGERFSASELQKKLCEHIRDFAGLETPQCCLDGDADHPERRPRSRSVSLGQLRPKASSRQQVRRSESKAKRSADVNQFEQPSGSGFAPRIDSLRISPGKFDTFDFDVDNAADTLVGSDHPAGLKSHGRPDSFTFTSGDSIDVFPRPPTANSKRNQPLSEVGGDQSAHPTPVASPRVNFHGFSIPPSLAPPSTVGASEDFQSVYSYTPPPSAQPTRDLPPVPHSAGSRTTGLTSQPNQSQIRSSNLRSAQTSSDAGSESTTALPALPSIERHRINHGRNSTNGHGSGSGSVSGKIHERRPSARAADDVDEITPVAAASPEPIPRHYRASSRAGTAENRLYASHLSREKLTLRGLQYP